MIRYILILPFFLLAENSNNLLQPFPHDLSVMLLRNFFPIYGISGSTLIGLLMSLLNMGMIAIVAVIIGYTVLLATVSSAIDGSNIKNSIQLWSLIRIVMGTLMLLPVYNGFTWLQAFILWMVINGIGLADNLWSTLVKNIVNSDGISSSQHNSSYWSELSNTIGSPTSSQSPQLITLLAQSELCLRLNYYQSSNDYFLKSSKTQGPTTYAIRIDNDCATNFTGICYGNLENPKICGTYAVNPNIINLSSVLMETAILIHTGIDSIFDSLYQTTLINIANDTSNNLQLYGCDPATTSPSSCSLATYIVSAASNYLNGIELARMQSQQANTAEAQNINAMSEQGWAVAGYYYAKILGQPSALTTINLSDYIFPYQSNNSTQSFCNDNQSAEMQTYCYLYEQLQQYNSPTTAQIQKLYSQIRNSASVVNSSPQNPNNMVNDPSINYAVALVINDLIYRINDSYFKGISTPMLSGMSGAIINAGSALTTGKTYNTASITVANLMNLSLCAAQAMTGVVVFDSGCKFDATYAPSSANCSSKAVKQACSLENSSQCLNVAINEGCISQQNTSMGMIGSFYYNQTNPIGQNPLFTIISIGRSLMSSGIQSLIQNAKQSAQLVIDAGLGLMLIKTPINLAMSISGAILENIPLLQEGSGLVLMGIGTLLSVLDMSYQLILFESKFMFDAILIVNTMIMSYGALYAIYCPSLPMIIYTLGVAGWFGVVIEAMIAAPIIAAGVTYPQGGQFLGSAEQGLQLGFSVFLRPSLLVLGLYMSALLAQISMDIVHYSILYFLAFILSELGSQSGLMNILVMFMLSIIYLSVAFEVISYSYTFITILPDKIMRWFLAGSSESLTQQNISSQLSSIQEQSKAVGEQLGRSKPSAQGGLRMLDPGLITSSIFQTFTTYSSLQDTNPIKRRVNGAYTWMGGNINRGISGARSGINIARRGINSARESINNSIVAVNRWWNNQ